MTKWRFAPILSVRAPVINYTNIAHYYRLGKLINKQQTVIRWQSAR